MGSITSRNIVETGQDENSATELGNTNAEASISPAGNVEEDTEPSTPLLNLSDPRPMSEACQRTETEDGTIEVYVNPIPQKKISTGNDNREVNSMVEKLLPNLEKDRISSITELICGIKGKSALESDEHSRSIVFGYDKYKLSISIDTLVQLQDRDTLFEVDLFLAGNELPDLKGKSRKKILDILARGGGKGHKKLIDCLTQQLGSEQQSGIEHFVSPYTKHIFVRNFTERTITKIRELLRELQINLSISGGGPCEYLMISDDQTEQLPSVSSAQEYQRKDATEQLPSARTQEYQQKIANSYKGMPLFRAQNTKIGVIDSGCSRSLYEQLIVRKTIVMPGKMISAEDASSVAIEKDYQDCYDFPSCYGHGTGVVEIIANCVLAGTEIFVANIGADFLPSNVECAMIELFKRDVDVLNCSFFVNESNHLATTVKAIKSAVTGVIVVAAVGNRNKDFVENGLNDGSTIMVGSHNDQNSISVFSSAQCRANICSRGESVYIASLKPNLRHGTSFAAPYVTAAVANILSYISPVASDLRRNLQLSAQNLICECDEHMKEEVNLKFEPISFMFASFRNDRIDAVSEPNKVRCCCFQNPKIISKRLIKCEQ